MKIIPVIDLLGGVVVHAKKGDRQHYRPIQSRLTASSKPLDIVTALLEYHPFQAIYIADLDAIQQRNTQQNSDTIQNIIQHFPNIKFWVDAGTRSRDELTAWQQPNFNVILGSENFSTLENFIEVATPLNSNFALSLDFMPNGYQGPVELLHQTQYWPKDVILMSLAHVGANHGSNVQLIEQFRQYAQRFHLYAAGGVRDINDLIHLKQVGLHGALIATAIHQKQLSSEQIARLSEV